MKSLIIVINNQNHRYHRRQYHEKRTKISDILLCNHKTWTLWKYRSLPLPWDFVGTAFAGFFWGCHFQFSDRLICCCWFCDLCFFCLLTINSSLILLRAGRDRKVQKLRRWLAESWEVWFRLFFQFIFIYILYVNFFKHAINCFRIDWRSHDGRNHFIRYFISLKISLSFLSKMSMYEYVSITDESKKSIKTYKNQKERSCMACETVLWVIQSQRSNHGKTFF